MADNEVVRYLNQIINLVDCPKDLNDSGKEVWGDGPAKKIVENELAIMIAQLFVDSDIDNTDDAVYTISELFGDGKGYKIIGDDKPRMSDIISDDDAIKLYLADKNNKVEIVRLKHSTGAGGGLSGFFVCQDNGPSDVVVDPIYLLTGGSLLDPASRTTQGENVRYLFPNWNGLTTFNEALINKTPHELPGKYITMLNMDGCIQTGGGIYPIKISKIDNGWNASIQLSNGDTLIGIFNDKMQAQSPEFKGNDTKNRDLANIIRTKPVDFISSGKKYLLAKELGDTLQVLWLKYICDLHENPGMQGGQRGGATLKQEDYHYGNTCVATTDIPLKCRAIANGVGVIHTGKDGTFYLKPRGELTGDQQDYVNTTLKTKLMEELLNHNESVINTIKDVIHLPLEGNKWIGENSGWNKLNTNNAKNYLETVVDELTTRNNVLKTTLLGYVSNPGVEVQIVKNYIAGRHFVSAFVMKKNVYHPLRTAVPLYRGEGSEVPVRMIPITPNANYQSVRRGGYQIGGDEFLNFMRQVITYANQSAEDKRAILLDAYRSIHNSEPINLPENEAVVENRELTAEDKEKEKKRKQELIAAMRAYRPDGYAPSRIRIPWQSLERGRDEDVNQELTPTKKLAYELYKRQKMQCRRNNETYELKEYDRDGVQVEEKIEERKGAAAAAAASSRGDGPVVKGVYDTDIYPELVNNIFSRREDRKELRKEVRDQRLEQQRVLLYQRIVSGSQKPEFDVRTGSPTTIHKMNDKIRTIAKLNSYTDNGFLYFYVLKFHPEIFTFGTMMSIGLLEAVNFVYRIKNTIITLDLIEFDNEGKMIYDEERVQQLCAGYRIDEDRVIQMIADRLQDTMVCIKYSRYMMEVYPQLASTQLKLFLNLFNGPGPFARTLTGIIPTQNELKSIAETLAAPPQQGGGDDVDDILPIATDIAMDMYELYYSLRIQSAYSDRKLEDLIQERYQQIQWHEIAIQEMKSGMVESDPYRLAILGYIMHILCKEFIELPIVKAAIEGERAKMKNLSTPPPNFIKQNALPAGITVGGRFKKTRNNRKLKKLKKLYKKTRNALRKSRKH